MFLTGFDSKTLNTLYVDKNLRFHGLIQAYSRTNRIINETKSQGNIVCFRNLKPATDEAITLFSNKEAIEEIILPPYESQVSKYKDAIKHLQRITPTVQSVDDLPDEETELKFVQAFREVIRLRNVLETFADYKEEELPLDAQTFEDYKSKYLDIYDKVKTGTQKQKVSILQDVDFELELIHRDEINVAYILKLLAKLKGSTPEQQERIRKQVFDTLAGEMQLRSKRELIENFIEENLPFIDDVDQIPHEFDTYVSYQKEVALQTLCEEEGIDPEKLNLVLGDYLFTQIDPQPDAIINMLQQKPKILERKTILERILKRLKNFVETYINGVGE